MHVSYPIIAIDYYAYLGKATLNQRAFSEIFSDRQVQEKLHIDRRQIAYTYYEKAKNLQKMRMEREHIMDLADFDRKYAIHFLSDVFCSVTFQLHSKHSNGTSMY